MMNNSKIVQKGEDIARKLGLKNPVLISFSKSRADDEESPIKMIFQNNVVNKDWTVDFNIVEIDYRIGFGSFEATLYKQDSGGNFNDKTLEIIK